MPGFERERTAVMSISEEKEGKIGRIQPFDSSGVFRGEDGVLHYEGLHRSLVEMLRETAERVPDREAVVEVGGSALTYREYWDAAARVAGGLAAAGIERGDRVAIRLPNGVDWTVAFFGSLMAGAIVIPVNTRFAEPEIQYVLEDSQAKHVFMPGEALPAGDPFVLEDIGPADVAAIFYTSGTTGQPKGAMTTHENFLSNVETVLRSSFQGADEDVRMLISVPLFHVTGCNSQLLVTARLGVPSVILPAFNVKDFLKAVVDYRTDCVVGTPAIFWLAINQPDFRNLDVSHVRWAVYGGAPMPPEQVIQMMHDFPNARLGNGYGLTETSSVTTFLPHEYCEDHPETVGFAAPVSELRLETEGFEGGAGELLVRGPQVVAGYWRKEEAHGRRGDYRRRRLRLDRRPHEGHDQPGRRERLLDRGGERVGAAPRRGRGLRRRRPRPDDGREGGRRRGRARGHGGWRRRAAGLRRRTPRGLQASAVPGHPDGAAAAEPRRQDHQARDPQRHRMGRRASSAQGEGRGLSSATAARGPRHCGELQRARRGAENPCRVALGCAHGHRDPQRNRAR